MGRSRGGKYRMGPPPVAAEPGPVRRLRGAELSARAAELGAAVAEVDVAGVASALRAAAAYASTTPGGRAVLLNVDYLLGLAAKLGA